MTVSTVSNCQLAVRCEFLALFNIDGEHSETCCDEPKSAEVEAASLLGSFEKRKAPPSQTLSFALGDSQPSAWCPERPAAPGGGLPGLMTTAHLLVYSRSWSGAASIRPSAHLLSAPLRLLISPTVPLAPLLLLHLPRSPASNCLSGAPPGLASLPPSLPLCFLRGSLP